MQVKIPNILEKKINNQDLFYANQIVKDIRKN